MSSDPCTQFPPAPAPSAAGPAPRGAASLPRVLSIAGTDPTGGAGTAADLKSIVAAGGYAMSVVTSVVAQNTHGVRAIHVPPRQTLAAQLEAVSDDVQLEAVKTGMLGTVEVIETVSAWVQAHPPQVLVVDPVMVASSGDRLLEPEAEQAMLRFCELATVVTPNIDELGVLTGSPRARTEAEAFAQARRWAARTQVAVVVKTGHLEAEEVANTWIAPDGTEHRVRSRRVETTSTHGTGCSLSSALATRLGAGHSLAAALTWATGWLHEAVEHGAALQVGSGHGPVDHGHQGRRLAAAGSAAPWLTDDAVPQRWEHPAQLAAADGDAVRGTVVPAVVPPAGPWTEALWAAGSPLAAEISRSGFVRALIDGSLPEQQFSFYLAQDAHYLLRYSRALAALGESSTDADARAFWAASAQECLTVEMALHHDWLASRPHAAQVPVGPVTSAYTDFLLARALGSPTVVGAAAALPCFWLYAQVGADLDEVAPTHPYAAWLETYRDPGFVEGVAGALAVVEAELAAADPAERAEAARDFLLACRHELEFFEQARRVEVGTADGAGAGGAGADGAGADGAGAGADAADGPSADEPATTAAPTVGAAR
ncbi:bifunctional hydroxymethylpyrimidine kinase/phosphomethylpyrimidine kinase [Brachybacterium saurashtrense]|uniref:Bifunctional hydroxymethylpyrimidine kinase/phosphomethylpyrimidine kinase n=1 Tax=Brachybacterium saurashtrense TaxID=556288 RepID=A0A345YQF5_9MICO|nr:bifunctional hydroxymethylpyrimidine kinase/phosphomethylpyrimidine kinase [Brachybacterium saurashtrense]AXK46157.1 bifunctional hydroxymethylpyrimidine kinase/phosphomethylpyrimidine kinase [Brachybacterium saurashtrense]RRR23897.1 bifunctional hydroxymethylpyrimidine kinase/phosphomethylpyrimidine kinase [Brachybacterium saurashtrense]